MMEKKSYTATELLERRLSGILPTILIAGDEFTVCWEDDPPLRKCLKFNGSPPATIRLEPMAMSDNGESYLCIYHIPTKTVIPFRDDMTYLPEGTVMLEIPFELVLDPVGVAREYGLKDTLMLDNYPIRQDLTARVIPLEETAIPDIIAKNLQQIKKRQKGKHRRKKR